MKILQMTDSDLQLHANLVLVEIVNSLTKEGFINKEKSDDVLKNYAVVVENDSWLPEFLQKFFEIDDGKMRYKMVKRI